MGKLGYLWPLRVDGDLEVTVTWGQLVFMSKVQNTVDAYPMVRVLIKNFFISLPLSLHRDFLMSNSRTTNIAMFLEKTHLFLTIPLQKSSVVV